MVPSSCLKHCENADSSANTQTKPTDLERTSMHRFSSHSLPVLVLQSQCKGVSCWMKK